MVIVRPLDGTDARILLALDDDPGATVVALAERLGLARNTVHARLRRLEADGALAPPSVRVRPAHAGLPVLAFLTLAISQGDAAATIAEIAAVPEVCEMHAITGDGDLHVRVVAADNADLHRITGRLLGCTGVVRSSTVISMVEVVPLRTAPTLSGIADR
ncbi:Transcriptional regulator, AsnC family [Pseudonocardia sp. Ae168_Ps1]|uniref:Lrp/AsnC family transcriptional regulator n=1 Tax=unclassified Pseudonocardia TaxID=2619320 RepID=UPI00094B0E04|nr:MULTISPECIES: Lrp/AsnC family transcriptional regulator [unclassified Pseudonocardia]OLL72864.1 Transcriptional regulator, AsnC family [Pseudonocardia sp. Ae150A_Ps1]OLL78838.1 Transcriptional regulator, AsnC family [Pseudonocardia sp. Ae168_Ps1]OLL87035.1 Transcriptional regulator, AsnC family [Pseudonocardia sp. Ae263_Ps1]OLL92934.1 Transcriptional regulator, AsnC family [Pseudonocardia sp. Ae356_Ps1]